ncbi:MAG TPA: hypothetical protein VMM16_14155 [Verrucomicrobiae bacterium]|nr:hypothetical protein [Verrucomicrobiae bacterium]
MKEIMRRRTRIAAALCLLAAGVMALVIPAMAAPPEKYLHVHVDDPTDGTKVNVNVPLSMAEKILPAINNQDLHGGKVWIRHADMSGVDLRAVLDAVKTAPDSEFVTVKDNESDVRVAKANGNILIHVTDKRNKDQKVDVTVPMKIVDALVNTEKNDELDIAAALRALSDAGDILLVTVQDEGQKVRIWVDSKNTQD